MKRFLIYLLLAAVVLLAGCQTESVQSEPTGGTGYDAQNKYLISCGFPFMETDSIYCGSNFSGDYLYYYDKETGTSGVLCADPTCTHDSYTCSAYLSIGGSPCYYEGKIYWVGVGGTSGRDTCLWCSDLTGLNREKVKNISYEDIVITYQPQQYTIHRGRLYFIGFNTSVELTEAGYRMSLVSTSLDDSEEFTAIFDRTTNLAMMPTMRFSGSCAYFSWYRENDDGTQVLTIEKYDTETGAYETVLENIDCNGVSGKFWVTEEGEVYVSGADESQSYLWRVENGELAEIVCWEYGSYNEPYLMDGIAVNFSKGAVAVRDFTGNVIYEGALFPEGFPDEMGIISEYSLGVVGGDADKLVLTMRERMNELCYTFTLDLQDNMKLTLLWGDEPVINKG